jgi:hypothetical protein
MEEKRRAFKAGLNAATQGNPAWNELNDYLKTADEVFAAACREKGLNPAEVDQLREVEMRRRAKQEELNGIEADLILLRRQVAGLPDALWDLNQVWLDQTQKRREMLEKAQKDMTPVSGGKTFVEFDLRSQADLRDFLEKWENLAPDRRLKLGREWQDIGRTIQENALKNGRSPWDECSAQLEAGKRSNLPSELADLIPSLAGHLSQRRDDWEKMRLQRIADDLDFTLRRQDGSRAGSLKDGGLSDGQRNTVVLSLLLGHGEGPVIIDQPEDELDSDFIYHELVPVISQVKRRRQIIFATHNPNLPVNGDAEFVYALKTECGRGMPRAQGGLDRKDVKDAVLDIMEGSDKAFLRRQEKYHLPIGEQEHV